MASIISSGDASAYNFGLDNKVKKNMVAGKVLF